MFIGYPRGTKGGLFYSPKDQKVIVSTNARFLEEDYMMDHSSKSKIILEELRGDRPMHTFSIPTIQEETSHEIVDDISLPCRSRRNIDTHATPAQHVTNDTQIHVVPHCSGRVVLG